VIGLDDWQTVAWKGALVVAGVMVLAILWGLLGPARKPKGPAPAAAAPPAAADAPPPALAETDLPPAEG
jgi:hypothetical protein